MGLFPRARTDPNSPPPHGSKWKRRLLGAFVAFLLLALLSPILIARTPLRNWIAAKALARLQGEVRIGGASLWWFSPPTFTDIEVRDAAGRTLLRAPRAEGGKSLVALLCHPLDLGEFRITQPDLHVVCSRDSTNVETALSYWLQKKDNQEDAGLALQGIAARAELTEGRLSVEDEDTGRTWTLDAVNVSVAVPHDRRTPLQLRLSAAVADAQQPGHLNAELAARLVEASGAAPRPRVEGELHAEGVPLAAAEPFLRRFEPHLKLDGRLGINLTLRQGDGQAGAPDLRLEGDVSLSTLALGDPLMGPDVLRLARVQAPFRLTLNGNRLVVEQVEIQSDVGQASLAGTVDLTRDPREALTQPGHRVDASLDLARLAGLVPNTLRLTKDTHIASGTLSLRVRSSARPDGVLWEGDLRTSDLQGLYQGQHLTWKEPLAVVFAVRQEANAWPVVERFRCDSDFLRLEMSGSLDEWTARAGFNLGRLSEHLAGFVDLGPVRLLGEGSARLSAKRNLRGGCRLQGDVQVAQLQLTDGGQAWREDNLTVRLDLVGEPMGGSYRVNAGGLHVLAGDDGIDLDLLEPIANVTAASAASARAARPRRPGSLARPARSPDRRPRRRTSRRANRTGRPAALRGRSHSP